MGQRSGRRRVAALSMKIRDDDAFLTVEVPVLRIRPCTPAEAAARTERWNRSRTRELRRRLEAAAKAEHRAGHPAIASAAGQDELPEPLPPWREVAAAWRHVCAKYDGLFLNNGEEEQARVACHRGGARWRIFRMELAERKRHREVKAQQGRLEAARRRTRLDRTFGW